MPFWCCGNDSDIEPAESDELRFEISSETMDIKFTDIKDLFDIFDYNKDGRISGEEILFSLRALQLPVTSEDVKDMMKKYDVNGHNELNFIEFTKLIKYYMKTKDFPLDGMFEFFDENHDELISKEEFVKAMRCLGVDMTSEKAEELLPNYYVSGTEVLDYENFMKLMRTYLA